MSPCRRLTTRLGQKIGRSGRYDLFVIAPNGFRRDFEGDAANGKNEINLRFLANAQKVLLTVTNSDKQSTTLRLVDNAYGKPAEDVIISAGGRATRELSVAESGNWYDFTLGGNGLSRRAAGRIETGKHGVSDPAMGA